MQYQRRQITDSRQQRWEDTPQAQQYAAWFAGCDKRIRLLKWATIIVAAQLVVWVILAWHDNPAHVVVFASMFVSAAVPVYIIGWSVKEL